MNWLLALNLLLVVVGVFSLIHGIIKGDENWVMGSIISLIVIGLIGFFAIGGLVTLETNITVVDVEISKSNKSVILEDYGNSGNMYVFDKKYDFDNISDTTTFFIIQGYNMYNIETDFIFIYYIDFNNNICEGEIR